MSGKNDLLAEEHLGLVRSCCKRFSGKGIEYEELYAAGCLGLTKAVNRFDESMGCRFSTYAFPVIMGEIKRLFRDGGSVKVSRSLRELALKINRLNNDNRLKNGCDLTISQLSKILGESPETITEAIACTRPSVSLNEQDSEGEERCIDLPSPDIQYEITERLSLYQALSNLEEKDRKIIDLRYFKSKTQTQTAKLLNMTQVQISRREKKILTTLRALIV